VPSLSRNTSTMQDARILATCVFPPDDIWRLDRDRLAEDEKELKKEPIMFVNPKARNSCKGYVSIIAPIISLIIIDNRKPNF